MIPYSSIAKASPEACRRYADMKPQACNRGPPARINLASGNHHILCHGHRIPRGLLTLPMIFPSWHRLVEQYRKRMNRLLSPQLFDLINHPELVQSAKFQKAAYDVARMMAAEVAAVNEKSWRAAAMKSSRARKIFEALREEIESQHFGHHLSAIAKQNAELISSVPLEIGQKITARAAELRLRGARSSEVDKYIRKLAPKLVDSRIRLIARNEVSKSETDLTRERSEHIGIDWYQWASSRDSRVRASHKNMDRVLVAWGDAPDPETLAGEKSSAGHYHAGQTYN